MEDEAPLTDIPLVDFSKLGLGVKDAPPPGAAAWTEVAASLKEALGSVGFVYLANHGIPAAQVEEVFRCSTKFFHLEEETKLRYSNTKGCQQGYMALNREVLDEEARAAELRESYYLKDVRGIFPDQEVPELRPAVSALHLACTSLSARLLTALALALDLEHDFFTSCHKGIFDPSISNHSTLRLNHYPPLAGPLPDNAIRCGAHTDFGSITLLFQDAMPGLQVLSRGGRWVGVRPIPGTLLINAGDILQFWTAGHVVATKHRVVVPGGEERGAARQSVVFFVHPDSHTLLCPLRGPDAPRDAAAPRTAAQHLMDRYQKTVAY